MRILLEIIFKKDLVNKSFLGLIEEESLIFQKKFRVKNLQISSILHTILVTQTTLPHRISELHLVVVADIIFNDVREPTSHQMSYRR